MQRLKSKLDYQGGVGSYKLDLNNDEVGGREESNRRDYGGVVIN